MTCCYAIKTIFAIYIEKMSFNFPICLFIQYLNLTFYFKMVLYYGSKNPKAEISKDTTTNLHPAYFCQY
ncbi:hypothetical protein MHA_2116 [Mannheimia haemolytica PHL213]|nr:hypothetical protein MHA_2116 [Mannheimia haemolytica PHL213]